MPLPQELSHPTLKRGDWRPWPQDDLGFRPMLTGLGDFSPLLTNGMIVIGNTYTQQNFICVFSNVPKIERNETKTKTPKKPSSRKTNLKTLAQKLEDLGINIEDLLK